MLQIYRDKSSTEVQKLVEQKLYKSWHKVTKNNCNLDVVKNELNG